MLLCASSPPVKLVGVSGLALVLTGSSWPKLLFESAVAVGTPWLWLGISATVNWCSSEPPVLPLSVLKLLTLSASVWPWSLSPRGNLSLKSGTLKVDEPSPEPKVMPIAEKRAELAVLLTSCPPQNNHPLGASVPAYGIIPPAGIILLTVCPLSSMVPVAVN